MRGEDSDMTLARSTTRGLPIRVKLMAACGGLALMTILVGSWGIWAVSGTNAAFQAVATQSTPALDRLREIDRDMQETLVAERSLMFMNQDTPDARAQQKRHAEKLRQVADRWTAYTAIPAGEAEKKLWAPFDTAREAWTSASRDVVRTVAADIGAARRDAIDRSMGEATQKFEALRKLLDRLIDLRSAQVVAHARSGEARAAQTRWWMVASVIAAAGLAVVCALVLARAIGRPLANTVALMRDIADGEGDLTKRLTVHADDEIGKLGASFNTFVSKLSGIVGNVRLTAGHVTAASHRLSGATSQLASGTQQQAVSLEQTAASLEEITATVKQNAENARQASQLAGGSRDAADRGGQVVTAAVASMEEITRSSKRIADIITVIDEIAFQTNLLALNAAVEAARAGEQGRGFAVVAAEVRNLAQRSAGAAKEIKALIQDSVTKIEEGSELVNRSGKTLEEIVTSAKRVADIVAEIAAACLEQSSGIDQVNRAVAQMDRVTQDNAAQTEELSSTSQALAARANEMSSLVSRFTLPDARRSAPAATPAPAAPRMTPEARPERRRTRATDPRPGEVVESATTASSNGHDHGNGHQRDALEEF